MNFLKLRGKFHEDAISHIFIIFVLFSIKEEKVPPINPENFTKPFIPPNLLQAYPLPPPPLVGREEPTPLVGREEPPPL